MKIWKIILAVLTIIIGIVLFAESEDVARVGHLANAFGVNVSALTIYAGYIVSILYIVISILLFVYLNKNDKLGDIIIIILSLIAFVFSFVGPQRFEDLTFTSFCAILCLITAIISIITKTSHQKHVTKIRMQCPQCGAQIGESDAFCGSCGKELPKETICPQCGVSINKNALFCPNCGKNLSKPMTDKFEHTVVDDENPTKKYLPYILGVIALIAICGAWYYWDSSKKKSANEKEFVDSSIIDNQNSNEAVIEKKNEANGDNANSKMHNFGLHSTLHHHLVGTFEDSLGMHPVELDFTCSGRDVTDVIYKNVTYGGKIRMTCTSFDNKSITVSGKDGNNDFSISLYCTSRNSFRGTAIDGEKELAVVMEANCQHE